jgi:hypothetical protein
MKVADYISQQIQRWPTLYKAADYETSKLRVLDHAFFLTEGEEALKKILRLGDLR